jgi:cytochrome c2
MKESEMRRFAILFGFLSLTPIVAAHAAGDPVAGQHDFASTCAACHSVQAGQNKFGPSLAGVVGRPSGTAAGYNYSTAMSQAHLTWDAATLAKFITNSQGLVHGTKMFVSVSNSQTRDDIIAYLGTVAH